MQMGWLGRFNSSKRNFNDCWKATEIGDNGEISRWYARGIGQVQFEYQGQKINLKNYGSGGMPSEILSTKPDNMSRILLTGFSGQVL